MRQTRLITAALVLSVAGAMLYFAVPRSVSGVIAFETSSTLSALRAGRLVPKARHDRLVRAQAKGLAWNAGGRHRIDSAFVLIVRQFARARGTGSKNSQQPDFKPAEGLLKDGLARSPVSADGWRWLAVARLAAKDRPGAASAVRMSLYSGPYEPLLVIARLRLLIRLWDQFPSSERELIYRQVRFAWSVSDDDVVLLATESPNTLWPFRVALARRPKDLLMFERQLRERLSKPAR